MNKRLIDMMKNFSYAISSNLITLLISTIVILFIPKIIGVEEFGYWQLYLFYSAYAGFALLGWNDGIYLKYGGTFYGDLNKKVLSIQFYMATIFQFCIVLTLFIFSNYIKNYQTLFIIQMFGIGLFITNVSSILLFILQATNRIKEFAIITIYGRLLYLLLLSLFLLIGIKDYKFLIVVDLIGKIGSLLLATYYCKEIVFNNVFKLYFNFRDAFENIRIGSKLMFANIASMLILGSVRFGIERSWDITTFGKISLTLNIANLVMIFVNSIGLVLFPLLRRTNESKLPEIYVLLRDFLSLFLLGFLIVYFPLKEALLMWLPQYYESFKYMAILFPMCIYEGKMGLLINTYLKTLRKEDYLFKINLFVLVVSLITTFMTTVIFKNLDLTVVSIIFLLVFRSVLAEYILTKALKIVIFKDTSLEIILTVIFILAGWYFNTGEALLIYVSAFLMYLLFKSKDFIKSFRQLKSMFDAKKEEFK